MDENQVDNVDQSMDMGSDAEKMLPQSQVDKIVQHAKIKASEATKRQLEEQHRRELEAVRGQQQTQRNETVSRDVDTDAIYQQVQERFNAEMQQKIQHHEMSQVANNYLSKMQKGPQSYDDFTEITKDFDPTAFPQLTYLVAGMDNAADIVYDLSKNPLKLAALDRLAEKTPQQARAELLKLSNSIAQNKQAVSDADSQQVAAPLDRLQPSRVSGSNGKMGISDLRNQSWLKG